MQRRILCLLVSLLIVAMAPGLSAAVEVKVKGEYKFAFNVISHANFYDYGWDRQSEDEFFVRQRTRIQVDFIASENLRGVYMAEIGELQWGRGGASLSADGVNVETKRAYIDFNIPNTELMFRVGIQGVDFPNVIAGHPVLDDDFAAVTAVWELSDSFGIVAGWGRHFDLDSNSGNNNSPDHDEMDIWYLWLPMQGDGWEVTPTA